jgi:hypothetical protein
LLAGAAIAQTPEPEPAWRASALAMVPAGYIADEAYRTDEPVAGTAANKRR